MKKVVKLTALSLALAFTSSLAFATENIAYFSADYTIQQHPDYKTLGQRLDAEFKAKFDKLAENKKQIEAKIADVQKKINDKAEALKKEAPKLRAADIKKREDEINKFTETNNAEISKLIATQDAEAAKYRGEVSKRENEEMGKIIESIRKATAEVAKAKNYTLVLQDNIVVYADEAKNITEDIVKALKPAAPAQAK